MALIISFVLVTASFFIQNCSFGIAENIDGITPTPVRCLFSRQEGCSTKNVDDIREHGALSAGRDRIKNLMEAIHKKIEKFEKIFDLDVITSNITSGLDSSKIFSNGLDRFKFDMKAIFPGTKWCGDGDKAEHYDDLGKFTNTDMCCRGHDRCPDGIAAGETDYGLSNAGLFTRSHCDCDKKFYDCLKNSDELISKAIGFTYFSILGPQCFKEDYPKVACKTQNM